jgi:DNA-binding transcriptional LysR family regulator
VALKVKYEVDHPETILAIVEAGLGVSLVPASLQTVKRPGITYRRLSPTGPALETVVAWRRESELSLVQAFVRVTREVARSHRVLVAKSR